MESLLWNILAYLPDTHKTKTTPRIRENNTNLENILNMSCAEGENILYMS